MTTAERQMIRSRIDGARREAVAERQRAPRKSRVETIRVQSPVKKPRFAGRCIYCGWRCYGRACATHRDLVQIEASQ